VQHGGGGVAVTICLVGPVIVARSIAPCRSGKQKQETRRPTRRQPARCSASAAPRAAPGRSGGNSRSLAHFQDVSQPQVGITRCSARPRDAEHRESVAALTTAGQSDTRPPTSHQPPTTTNQPPPPPLTMPQDYGFSLPFYPTLPLCTRASLHCSKTYAVPRKFHPVSL
jgi:hypothetical protein